MNRRIFANLILYDIRKGFRENKIKWIVGVFIFVFFSFITVSDFSVNSPELGFWHTLQIYFRVCRHT